MYKKLLILFVLLFMLSNAFAWCTGTDCNSDWSYRQQLELNTTGILTSDVTNEHAILVHVDSTNTDFWENSNYLTATNETTLPQQGNLIAYWKLDETSGTILDAVNSHDFTNSGLTQNQAGQVGVGVLANGSSGDAFANYSADLDTQYLSISLWIKPNTTTSTQYLFTRGDNTHTAESDKTYELSLSGANVRFRSNGVELGITTGNEIVVGKWQHIGITFNKDDSPDGKIYVNGVDSADITGSVTLDGDAGLTIGSNTGVNSWFDGSIDEIGLWDTKLTEGEIQEVYEYQRQLKDVRFTNEDDTIDLNYHFESVDTDTNDLWAWVRVPEFDADANTIINMYYGNADAVDNQNEAGTYPSAYKAVWHMNSLLDSTNNNNDLTASASPLLTSSGCAIAQCYDLERSETDYFTVANESNFDIAGTGEYSLLAIMDSESSGINQTYFSKRETGSVNSNYDHKIKTGNNWGNYVSTYGVGSDTYDTATTQSGGNNYAYFTYNNGQSYWYINGGAGALDTGTPAYMNSNNTAVKLGTYDTDYFDGLLDEIKFLTYEISADEAELLYTSESSTLLSFGTQEEYNDPYINADFNWSIDRTNSRIILTDNSTDRNVTINTWQWKVDGTNKSTDQNYNHGTQANLDLNICLTVSGLGIDGNTYSDSTCQDIQTWDTITPTMDLNIDTDAFGFVTDFGIDYNLICYDNFSPINYLITWTDNGTTHTLYDSDDANATLYSGNLDLNAGQKATLTFTCTDDYNNFVTRDSNTIYALQFYLIDEDTAETFDLNNVVTARAYTYNGLNVYDFKDTNTTTKYFFSDSTVVQFEFTYDDLSATKLSRDIDFQYAPDTNIPVCVAEPQTFYEQRFLSKSTEIVILKNTFANCYNMISTTKDLYGTKLMARAFTINKPYTYASTAGTTIAYIDGSKESEIDLDILRYNQTTYELDILGTSISFAPVFNESTGEYDSNTVRWYYQDLSAVSTTTILQVYKGNDLLWTYTEVDDPNDFEATMFYGDLNLTTTDLLTIKITKTTTSGTTVVERTFSLNGVQYAGVLNPMFAVIIAIILLVFGLTITSYKQTFGWFGLMIEGIALIVLALAPWYWYITFLIGIVLILMIFTGLVAKQETGGII